MIVLSLLMPVNCIASLFEASGRVVSSITFFLMSLSAAQSRQVANAKVFGLGNTVK